MAKKKIDFGRLVPMRAREFSIMDNGCVSVRQPRFFNGFVRKLAESVFHLPDVNVKLDDKGTFVWNLCDGKCSNADIAEKFAERFGNDDVYDRLYSFMCYLEKCEMISYVNREELENA